MKKVLVTLLVLSLGALPVPAWTQQPEETPDVEPKFIWGILIKYVAGEVFSMFSQWMMGKMNERYGTNISGASYSATATDIARLALDHFRRSRDTTGGAVIRSNPTLVPVGLKETQETTSAAPGAPLKLTDGTANYEGIHLAIVGADRSGTITELRPVKAGFKTGERFKLRAMSTFGGLLVIENINPRGERRQIYPGSTAEVIVLPAGADTLLPLGPDQFFEFAKTTGEEQLVITLRDPRAVGDAASRQKVYRKDEEYGTHFVQEASKGTYPVISEAIRLQHH
ncbi:MAG TPA: hypothetical protein VM183_07595 [Burkholderiales bacterium]|nr:hypothetical protein [Burkholderiales bacterium]